MTGVQTCALPISTGVLNGTSIATNSTYTITPSNSVLLNNTDYTFGFNVSSGNIISFISMNITNSSGYQLVYQSYSGQGYLSSNLNTGNYTVLYGKFIITSSTGESFSFSKIWNVGDIYAGEYSIFTQLKLFSGYGFSDFWRIIIVMLSIGAIMLFLTTNDVLKSGEEKIIVLVLIVWGFSTIGLLNISIGNAGQASSSVGLLQQFSRQYGIAILMSGASAMFWIKRLFR